MAYSKREGNFQSKNTGTKSSCFSSSATSTMKEVNQQLNEQSKNPEMNKDVFTKDILYDFPSFPNLTPEEHQRLSQVAFRIFHCCDKVSVTISDFCRHLVKNPIINPTTDKQYTDLYFGPNDTTIEEFANLPEIACMFYPAEMTDAINKKHVAKYRSWLSSFLSSNPIHNFRLYIIICLKQIVEKGETLEFGAITLEKLCEHINKSPQMKRFFKRDVYPSGILRLFVNQTFQEALCCYCSREIVIRISKVGGSSATKIRLRNNPDYLLQKILEEQKMTVKALEFCKAFATKFSSEELSHLRIDSYDLGFNHDLTFVSWYPSFFLDNVYAALHHAKTSIHDFASMCTAITKYTVLPVDTRMCHHLTENRDLNFLIEMISPEALEAVEFWKEEEKSLYMKIANELASKLNEFDRDFVIDFVDAFPRKSEMLAFFNVWIFKRMVRHVLLITQQPDFIDENKIAEKILSRFKYNLLEWIKRCGMSSFEDLFQNVEVLSMFDAILVKTQNGKRFFRNIVSIMGDRNLVEGFPFSVFKELLNALQQGVLWEAGDKNGFINEALLIQIYERRYRKRLDQSQRRMLFGENYGTIKEFLDAFDFDEISTTILPSGEIGYRIKTNFNEALAKIMEEKRKRNEAAKHFIELFQKLKDLKKHRLTEGSLTNFIAWKKSGLDYELRELKSKRMVLSRAKI